LIVAEVTAPCRSRHRGEGQVSGYCFCAEIYLSNVINNTCKYFAKTEGETSWTGKLRNAVFHGNSPTIFQAIIEKLGFASGDHSREKPDIADLQSDCTIGSAHIRLARRKSMKELSKGALRYGK